MNMKKIIAVFMASAVLFSLAGCSKAKKEEDKTPKNTLYTHGLQVVDQMIEKTNRDYLEVFVSANQEITDYLSIIRERNYRRPEAVYEFKLSTEAIDTVLESDEFKDYIDDIPDSLIEDIIPRLSTTYVTQLNAQHGSAALAAASVCSSSVLFVDKTLEQSTTYIYVYKDSPAVVVTFTPGEDGAVLATGNFLLNTSQLDVSSKRDFERSLDDLIPVDDIEDMFDVRLKGDVFSIEEIGEIEE